jgi:NTP pyrophosphatase (non-canonical NTP hydrolase)
VDNEAEIILMEECGELVQALSKVLRTEQRPGMVADMVQEMADVSLLISLVKDKYKVDQSDFERRMRDKAHKLQRWSDLYGNT